MVFELYCQQGTSFQTNKKPRRPASQRAGLEEECACHKESQGIKNKMSFVGLMFFVGMAQMAIPGFLFIVPGR
jgi:hypothetical protein